MSKIQSGNAYSELLEEGRDSANVFLWMVRRLIPLESVAEDRFLSGKGEAVSV